MNNKTLIGLFAAVAVVGGLVGGYLMRTSVLGGDFAGGVVPNQLFTTNTATNGITPVGSLNFGFGGSAAANQIVNLYTAIANYPAALNVNLGPLVGSTSTTSTVVSFNASGFSVGDACEVSYNGTTSTLPFGADAFVTAVSGSNVSATVTFWNGAGATTITLTPTSTATGASSTLKTTCFHTGV